MDLSDSVRAIVRRLFDDGAIDEAKLKEGLEIAEGAGLPLLRVLLHMKLVDTAPVAAAIQAVMERPIVDLDQRPLPPSPIPEFTAGLCRELRVFPLILERSEEPDRKQLVLAMSDPSDANAGERVAALFGYDVRPVLVDDGALTRAIVARFEPNNPAGDPPPKKKPSVATAAPPFADDLDLPTRPSTHRSSPEVTALLLVESITSSGLETDEGAPAADSVENVFTEHAQAPVEVQVRQPEHVEKTVLMRAPSRPDATRPGAPPLASAPSPDRTVIARSPFLETSRTDVTTPGSIFSDAVVCFVSRDPKARLRVAADLALHVREAIVLDELARAAEIVEQRPPDAVVVHAPKNDAPTGLLLDRIARAIGEGVVVISDDEAFALLPCVRTRLSLPLGGPQAIAPLILEHFFETGDIEVTPAAR